MKTMTEKAVNSRQKKCPEISGHFLVNLIFYSLKPYATRNAI